MERKVFKPKFYFWNLIAFYPWLGFGFLILSIVTVSFHSSATLSLRIFFPILIGVLMYVVLYRHLRESSTKLIIDKKSIERKGLFGKNIKVKWNEIEWMQEYVYQWFDIKLILNTKYGKIHIPDIIKGYDKLKEIIQSHNIKVKEAKIEGAKTVKILFRFVLLMSVLIIAFLIILGIIKSN